MKYTITEVKTSQVKVEYENGSTAEILIDKAQTNLDIRHNIKLYSGTNFTAFEQISDVPLLICPFGRIFLIDQFADRNFTISSRIRVRSFYVL